MFIVPHITLRLQDESKLLCPRLFAESIAGSLFPHGVQQKLHPCSPRWHREQSLSLVNPE